MHSVIQTESLLLKGKLCLAMQRLSEFVKQLFLWKSSHKDQPQMQTLELSVGPRIKTSTDRDHAVS